jgi:cell division protein FtsA
VVGEFLKGEKIPKIIGVGESETKGTRFGYVRNPSDAIVSIKKAVEMAEKTSGIKIKQAFVAIGGISLNSENSSGSAIISKANGEITSLDVDKALEDSENNLNLNNRKVVQAFPASFKVDGKEVMGRPEGMHGKKLETKVLFITCSVQHLEDLLGIITEVGIEPLDVLVSSLVGSSVVLSEKQKIVGSALINIGSETVSLGVFENGLPISIKTFPIGSSDITNDIALGFKISLEKAESLKVGNLFEDYPKKKLDEIIEARLSDIFELIESHLKKIKRNGLLPAGVVLIGGGANIQGLEEFSKSFLKLPSKIGVTKIFGNTKTKLNDPSWFVTLGLLSENEEENQTQSSFSGILKNFKNIVKSNLKQLMP